MHDPNCVNNDNFFHRNRLSAGKEKLKRFNLGYPVLDCAKILSINSQIGYNWQAAWNESGMDSVIPNYEGGRPSKITEEQRSRLKEQVDRENMTTGEARQFMKDVFHVEHSVKQVHIILSGMGLRHAKPYSIDRCRPDDAGQRLKKPRNSAGYSEGSGFHSWIPGRVCLEDLVGQIPRTVGQQTCMQAQH